MKSSYRVGSIWGIPLKLHISIFILYGYACLQAYRMGYAEQGFWMGAFALIAVAILQPFLFACIGLHELGHSYIAIRKGCKVREITLMLIGGAAVMENIPRRPKDEFLMAIAGPAVSVTLALLSGLLALLFPADQDSLLAWFGVFFQVMAWGNGLLAAFNLTPAFPMDGGRIIRALLAVRFGRLRATRLAVLVGRGFAIMFASIGLLQILQIANWTSSLQSYLLLLIAGFIYVTGNREYQQIQFDTLLEQRGFKPKSAETSHRPFTDIPPDDETVVISPPPYSQGPANLAHLEKDKEKRFPFFS